MLASRQKPCGLRILSLLVFRHPDVFVALAASFVHEQERGAAAIGKRPQKWHRGGILRAHEHMELEQVGVRHFVGAKFFVHDEIARDRRLIGLDFKAVCRAALLHRRERLTEVEREREDEARAEGAAIVRDRAVEFKKERIAGQSFRVERIDAEHLRVERRVEKLVAPDSSERRIRRIRQMLDRRARLGVALDCGQRAPFRRRHFEDERRAALDALRDGLNLSFGHGFRSLLRNDNQLCLHRAADARCQRDPERPDILREQVIPGKREIHIRISARVLVAVGQDEQDAGLAQLLRHHRCARSILARKPYRKMVQQRAEAQDKQYEKYDDIYFKSFHSYS